MKTKIILFLLLFNGLLISAQEIKAGNNFYFTRNLDKQLIPKKVKILNGTMPSNFEIIKKSRITVLHKDEDYTYFSYWNYTATSDMHATYNEDSSGNTRIFKIKNERFKNLTSTYYNKFRGFKFGTYSVPIRLRNSDGVFEFDSNLSLGASLVARFSLSRYNQYSYIDISGGISITKVNLNPENSNLGSIGDFETVEALSPAAITPTIGILVGIAKNVNLGTYVGWDHISTADNKAKWIYDRKPWVGIGLNIAFTGNASQSDSKSGK